MKKITQLFVGIILMLLTVNTTFSQTEYQLDSIQRFDWNTNTTAFKMNSREHFTYDNGGTKETYSNTFILSGTVWSPSLRYTKTYNEDNNVIDKFNDTYNSILNTWNVSIRELHGYDASQNLVLIEEVLSSDNGVTWDIPRAQTGYFYNTDNLVTEKFRLFYNTISMSFVNSDKTTTSYNGLNIADEISQFWSSSSSSWLNNLKIEYTYNGDIPIQKGFFSWLSSDWDSQPYLQLLNTYDGSLLTEETSQVWNSSGSIWENNFRTTHTYDTNGNIQEVRTYDWDDNTSTWLNLKQELWYWTVAGAILSVEEENKLSINVYPNPTTEYFTISNLNENTTIAMYDVQGKQVGDYAVEANQNSKIYTNQFNSGIYFLKISSGTGTISKKLIVK